VSKDVVVGEIVRFVSELQVHPSFQRTPVLLVRFLAAHTLLREQKSPASRTNPARCKSPLGTCSTCRRDNVQRLNVQP